MKIKNGKAIEIINEFEYELEKLKYLQSKYSDLKLWKGQFCSKLVNSNYTNLSFIHGYWDLTATAYLEETFKVFGKIETVKIYASPMRLLICGYRWCSNLKEYRISFSKLQKNIKTNKFKIDLYQDSKIEIVSFIKKHPDKKIDFDNMDKKLKDLILFI